MKKTEIETTEELKTLQDFENNKFAELNQSEFNELNASLQNAATNTIKRLSKKKSISMRPLHKHE